MERRTGSPLDARRHDPARATPPFLLKTPHRFLRLLAPTPKMRRRRHKTSAAFAASPTPFPISHKQKQPNLKLKLEAQAQTHDGAIVSSSSAAASPSPPALLDSNKRKQPRQSQVQATPPPTESSKKLRRPGQSQTQIYVGEAQAHAPQGTTVTSSDSATSAVVVAGKYWLVRHSLFSLYDRGVRMDAEGWYSVTPEAIAAAQAARAVSTDLVVDAFAGVGGNTIQFAARGCYVVAVEIDSRKVEFAMHNARIYGVEDRIECVVGDFLQLAPFLKGDVVFLSPPWGGPSYNQTPTFTLDMLKPKDGYAIFRAAQKIAPNIIMFLPRNVDISQVEELSWLSSPPLDYENYLERGFKGITAYFGNIARAHQLHHRN